MPVAPNRNSSPSGIVTILICDSDRYMYVLLGKHVSVETFRTSECTGCENNIECIDFRSLAGARGKRLVSWRRYSVDIRPIFVFTRERTFVRSKGESTTASCPVRRGSYHQKAEPKDRRNVGRIQIEPRTEC